MRKFLIVSLMVIAAFTFCKKSSTDNGEEEDIITIKIAVTKDGSALSSAQVNLRIERKYIVNDPLNSGPPTSSLSSEYPHDGVTGPDGTTTFTLRNCSIVASGSVFVRHVKISAVGHGTLVDEDVNIEVKTGETETIDYDF